jgi:beta-glucosidase
VLDATPVDGVLEYSEGLLLGYRGYDASGAAPLFPFGHGLGYTSWDYEIVQALTPDYQPGRDLDLRVVVRNAGSRRGREVVQAYLAGPPGDQSRPLCVLAAFGSAEAAPDEQAEVLLRIPARLFAQWDEDRNAWTWPAGPFTVLIGRSSRDLRLSLPVPAA